MRIIFSDSTVKSAGLSKVSKCLAVCAIFAVVVACGRGELPKPRSVIISSDDAGMCSSTNQGTIDALRAGLVKSTSIMTCCPAFDEFAEFAQANPQYDYGVHLTLTCDSRVPGWGPVVSRNEVPSLVDEKGLFFANPFDVARSAILSEAATELRSQVRKAFNAGINITHLDHHMWVLFARPVLLKLYVDLGEEFQLPIRFSHDIPREIRAGGDELLRTYKGLLDHLGKSRIPVLDQIEMDNYAVSPSGKREFFLNRLRAVQAGTTEFVIHCAAPARGVEPPDFAARIADTECFTADEFQNEISRGRINVADWKSFARRR